MPRSDIADTRALYEREIADYRATQRQIEDLRRLCLRVAQNAHREGFVIGFIEGRLFELEGQR